MVELVIFWLLLCVGVGWLAAVRGRSGPGWFLLSFLFSPVLMVVILACLQNLTARPDMAAQSSTSGGERVKCPECAELVLREARKCKHCGSILAPAAASSTATVPARPPLRLDEDWQRRSGLPPS